MDRERQSSSEFVRNRDASFEDERVRRLASEDSRIQGNGARGLVFSAQLDDPGPPTGANLHSASVSEIEKSMMNLQHEKDDKNEEDDKNEAKQHHNSREKVEPFFYFPFYYEFTIHTKVLNAMRIHEVNLFVWIQVNAYLC